MKILNSALIALFVILLATPSLALDLQTARSSGFVGENLNGYVVALSPTEEAKKLAADVNSRRKSEYERISKENGQTTEVVGKVAAAEIIKKLPKGSSYQANDGTWKKK